MINAGMFEDYEDILSEGSLYPHLVNDKNDGNVGMKGCEQAPMSSDLWIFHARRIVMVIDI